METVTSAALSVCGDHREHSTGSDEDAAQSTDKTASHQDEERSVGGPKFNPPVYRQRYILVQEVLEKHGVESVVDFGCAECKIARFLKNVETVQKIALVDMDRGVLEGSNRFIEPDNFESLLLSRLIPLSVSVFCGSAGELDGRVVGYQAATLVEIIEHLEPDMLQKVTHNVFGRLRPDLVIVTTPNADFNIVFPNFSGFRHYDHKFEWTREEFQQWGEEVCTQHGYTVQYTGVGDPPSNMSHVGFCSQVAIFTETSGRAGEQTEEEVYELVRRAVYPYDRRTSAERLAHEMQFIVYSACKLDCHKTEDDLQAVVPVSFLMGEVQNRKNRRNEKWAEEDVMKHLRSEYRLTDGEANIVVQLAQESSDSDSDFSEGTSDHVEGALPQETVWEEEESWD